MELFTDDIIRGLLAKSLKTATVDENGWRNVTEEGGSDAANDVSFLTISNLAGSVIEDVQKIKNHPLVPKDIPIYGYIYEVETGKLVEVPEATEAGKV